MAIDTSVFNKIRTIDDYKRAKEEFDLNKKLKNAQIQEATFKASPEGKTSTMPATLQVNSAIQKALDAGDYDTANRIAWLSRSQAYGVDTFSPQGSSPETFKPFQPKAPTQQPMEAPQPIATEEFIPTGSAITQGGSIAQQQARNAAMKKAAEKEAELMARQGIEPDLQESLAAAQIKGQRVESREQDRLDYESPDVFTDREKMEQSEAARAERLLRSEGNIVQDVGRGIEMLEKNMKGAVTTGAGMLGSVLRNIPSTDAQAISKLVGSAKSNISIEELQSIRESSPTGGALGQVPVQQQEYLMELRGSLDLTQRPEILLDNMKRVWNTSMDIAHGTPEQINMMVEKGVIDPQRAADLSSRYPLQFDEFGRQSGEPRISGARQEMEAMQGKFKNKSDINQLINMYAP